MTLVHQGGPMNDEEAAIFEQLENFEAILRMRSWDEQAKVDMIIDPLDKYETMCKNYLKNLKWIKIRVWYFGENIAITFSMIKQLANGKLISI